MLGGGGAGAAVSGPGAEEVDGPAVVGVILGATWVVVVVLVVAAVVDTEGPPWANALHTPEALSRMAITPCHVMEPRLHIQNVAVTHCPPLKLKDLTGIRIGCC
ncbi:hypothetical protein NDU88_005829 [Pleurodeles waltl]|uniref:Uncharacterized protein n=1 Tax=Pleurodeles waltl TaxID=8319 RepID=A0AAV7VMD5_PLEWA|nr:hypothetical protein NDU88_005829 [Pleurodeles waltl]